MRPRILVTAEKIDGLRSLEDVRASLKGPRTGRLWEELKAKAHRECGLEVWTPATPLPQRREHDVQLRNREYTLVGLTANRIIDGAAAGLISGDQQYAQSVLAQIRSILDERHWPEIEDLSHLQLGDVCSLRRGQLATAIGLAYDWLHGQWSDAERMEIVRGFDERFTSKLKLALSGKGSRWGNWRSNFVPAIFGGFGIAGMGMAEDYDQSDFLTALADERMERYAASIFGREGEFNESVQYAGSTSAMVSYFAARRYARGGEDDALRRLPLADFCRWYVQMTFPPGRVAGFGDPAADMPPVVDFFAALASALRDGLFQWFYLQYADGMLETHRKRGFELLWYDGTVAPQPPLGRLPLGRAYHDEGKLVSSRSSWDPRSAVSVVYAKAGREDNHGHADWGQVCIDGFGERLIVDLGSTPGYPRGHKERYYNYQQSGHNVWVLGQENETGGMHIGTPGRQGRRYRQGSISAAEFDASGGRWTMDLTEVYDEVATRVVRKIIHLLPRVVAVLDEVELKAPLPMRMRWHTIAPAELGDGGCFLVCGKAASLSCLAVSLEGEMSRQLGRHEYRAPFDKDRLGGTYPQRHEPYVEFSAVADKARLLSLFCIFGPREKLSSWQPTGAGWSIETSEGLVAADLTKGLFLGWGGSA